MKKLDVLLALALGSAIAGACSATAGSSKGSGGSSGSGGNDASSTGGSSGTASGGSAGVATGGSAGGGAGGAGGAASGGTSGSAGSTSFGGSSGSSGSSGTGGFDAGVSDANEDTLIGDGGTTVVIGPGADANTPGKFNGTVDPNAVPTVVYPQTGVMVPPNMNKIEFHFIPAAGQTLFKLAFHAPTTNLEIYVACTALGAGCVYAPDQVFWDDLVAYARGTVPVTWTLSGVDGAGNVGTSGVQTMIFGQNNIVGGIYYWNTAGVIQRYDFGNPTKTVEQYLTPAVAGGVFCVGCHVLSRDGSLIAAGKDIPSPAPYTVFNVGSKTPFYAGGQAVTGTSNFFSFSPDGSQLLLSGGVKIQQRSLVTGAITNASVVNPGTMPDWSPDGSLLVYAKPSQTPFAPEPGVAAASLELLSWTGSAWNSPKTLVPFAGENNYYPAFSPDSNWVAFNRSPGNHESFSNAAPDADAGTLPDGQLWVVSRNGGTPIQLSTATHGKWCSWPKWAPNVQSYYDGKIMWLTFSSSRPYGLRLSDGQRTQLWMVAFDPAKAAAGQDGSFPAFWLPFQQINGGNHIAQWTTQVVRKSCVNNTQCGANELCRAGYCYGG